MREDLLNRYLKREAHRYFLEKVPENLEISWWFHEISFATMMEYKPALDILAPRASLCSAGLDGDSNSAEHVVPLEVQIRVTQGPHVWASWSRCLLLPDLASLWVPSCSGDLYTHRWREEKSRLEMDAYLDDFKTSILLDCERGSGEASRDYRGPIDSFLKRSPISWDFHEMSFATMVEKITWICWHPERAYVHEG